MKRSVRPREVRYIGDAHRERRERTDSSAADAVMGCGGCLVTIFAGLLYAALIVLLIWLVAEHAIPWITNIIMDTIESRESTP